MKALIVEPNKLFQQILNTLFNNLGFEAVVTPSGQGASRLAGENRFDLICVAMHLEDMSGVDFARQEWDHEERPHIPIIMLTAEADKLVLTEGLKAGITEVFQKNKLPELSAYLQRFIHHAQRQDQLNGRVLLVEDEGSVAMLLEQLLREMGLGTEHYETAEEALEALSRQEFDLILIDFMLAGSMSGLGLVQAVRAMAEDKARLPILALSGLDQVSRRIELFRAGASDYIAKPVIQEELVARVRNLITNKQLFDEVELQRQRLEELALTDQLTGLYNRHSLLELAGKYISEAFRHEYPLSLIVVDVDHFKTVNDTHGHSVGDVVLKAVSGLFRQECRGEDFVARFGGEEFVIILTHCARQEALHKAESLREKLENLNPVGLKITASFGVAGLPEDNKSDFDTLFNVADQALYKAKQLGRNRVCALG